ncbi:MAG: ADP-ribosylglycohydrolase family protein [Selenomonadaceae bacterium]|nr:ADP-ribosylglycohydrolase family protein [Selenomonadaceae bacterium]
MITEKICISMLLGHAVADAAGVPVEFTKRQRLKEKPVVDMRAYGTYGQPAGTWSDDTSLTVAAMESMTRLKKIDYEDILKNFLDWYNDDKFTATDETFDCGNTTAEAIANFRTGIEPLNCGPTQDFSAGNGSLMRISPVAMYLYLTRGKNLDAAAMETVHNFSSITHGQKKCLISCGIYCLIAVEIFDGQDLKVAISNGLANAKKFYENLREFEDTLKIFDRVFDEKFAGLPEDEIKSRGYVVDSLEAAIWCLQNTDNYKDLVLKAVNLGGDTDTIAAIAGGLAGAFYGLENIPEKWLGVLKKKDYLEKMAADFYNAFK